MERICPFCKEKIKPSKHIYLCCNDDSLSKDDIKFEYIKYNFPKISNKTQLIKEYSNGSLPEIKDKYEIDFKSTMFLLKYFNIKKRNISESANLISVKKYKKTCENKYGVDNISKLEKTKKQKKYTTLKNFGVDNIWKHPDYSRWIDESFMSKYNLTKNEYLSMIGKINWNKKTEKEKIEYLNKSIFSVDSVKKVGGYSISKLENRISKILNSLNLNYEKQFVIKTSTRTWKIYDFLLKDYNIIVEVNGDYWHANPHNYKSNDSINYPWGKTKAKNIWKKDKKKKKVAENKGYKIICVWETEMKESKSDNKLIEIINNKINKATD